MLQNYTFKSSYNGKFHVMTILTQFLNDQLCKQAGEKMNYK